MGCSDWIFPNNNYLFKGANIEFMEGIGSLYHNRNLSSDSLLEDGEEKKWKCILQFCSWRNFGTDFFSRWMGLYWNDEETQ